MDRERILFIGRFEPFHKGHEYMVRTLVRKYGTLIVGIGRTRSIRKGRKREILSPNNPFTYARRKTMIELCTIDIGKKLTILPIDDSPSDARWTAHVIENGKRIGGFTGFVTNNSWVAGCLSPLLKRKKAPKLLQRWRLEGTKIRKLMSENDPEWKKRVNPKVAAFLKR